MVRSSSLRGHPVYGRNLIGLSLRQDVCRRMSSGHTGLVSTGFELSGDQREINGQRALHMAPIARKADVLPPTVLKAHSLANH